MKHTGTKILLMIVVLFGIMSVKMMLKAQKKHVQPQILLETEEERQRWLNLHGWQTAPPECTSVTIPSQWQTVQGESWIRLQHAQGFSPEQYAGQNAEKYSYQIINDTSTEYRAELWICSGILIGAEIYDAKTQVMQSVL